MIQQYISIYQTKNIKLADLDYNLHTTHSIHCKDKESLSRTVLLCMCVVVSI